MPLAVFGCPGEPLQGLFAFSALREPDRCYNSAAGALNPAGRYVQGRSATQQLGEQLQKVGIESPIIILVSGVRVSVHTAQGQMDPPLDAAAAPHARQSVMPGRP